MASQIPDAVALLDGKSHHFFVNVVCLMQEWQTFQPEARPLHLRMTELPRLDDLIRLPVRCAHHADGILNRYPVAVRHHKLIEEGNRLSLQAKVLRAFREPALT